MQWILGIGCPVLFIVVVVGYAVSVNNRLIRGRNGYQNAYAQIDVQLIRRHDLIPNLVETAKGYIKHERETLEAVVNARANAVGAQAAASKAPGDPAAMGQLAGAENVLTQALGRLFAVAEAYPNLKANENMMQLSEELTSTENRVAFARQAYNDSVMSYNNQRQVFPATVIAGPLGFKPAALLDIEQSQRQPPSVSFS
jgi:LemA protein